MIVGTPQANTALNAGNITLTFDVPPQEGDVVLVLASPGLVNGGGVTIGAGYETLQSTPGGTGIYPSKLARKVMGPTPDTSVLITNLSADGRNTTAALCYVLRGYEAALLADLLVAKANAAGTNPVNCPPITTAAPGSLVLALAVAFLNSAVMAGETLANYANGAGKAEGAGTFDATIRGCTREVAAEGVEDPPAFTPSSASWTAYTVALRPSAAAPPVEILVPSAIDVLIQ